MATKKIQPTNPAVAAKATKDAEAKDTDDTTEAARKTSGIRLGRKTSTVRSR